MSSFYYSMSAFYIEGMEQSIYAISIQTHYEKGDFS